MSYRLTCFYQFGHHGKLFNFSGASVSSPIKWVVLPSWVLVELKRNREIKLFACPWTGSRGTGSVSCRCYHIFTGLRLALGHGGERCKLARDGRMGLQPAQRLSQDLAGPHHTAWILSTRALPHPGLRPMGHLLGPGMGFYTNAVTVPSFCSVGEGQPDRKGGTGPPVRLER